MVQPAVMMFGATRGTGLEAARALREQGAEITAVVRASSDTASIEQLGAATRVADIFSPAEVAALFTDHDIDCVVLSLSGKRGEERRADREGVRIIVEAAKAAGVTRIVMVTAIGCGDSRQAVAPKVLEVLGEVLAAKTEAENFLLGAGVQATILRPGGLVDGPATGTAIRTDDYRVMGVINRADLGSLVADCVLDPGTAGQVYHTVDPGITWQAPLQRGDDVTKP